MDTADPVRLAMTEKYDGCPNSVRASEQNVTHTRVTHTQGTNPMVANRDSSTAAAYPSDYGCHTLTQRNSAGVSFLTNSA